MIKKIVIMALGLMFALAIAAVAVPFFIDSNSFKAVIIKQVAATTGYRLVIDGDMSIRLLPQAHLRAEKVAVYNPQFTPDKPFAQMEVLDIGVKLMPLMKGKVDITNIVLEKPLLSFVRWRNGSSWDVKREQDYTPGGQAPARKNTSGMAALGVVLHGVTINDGAMTYEDRETKRVTTLNALNVKAETGALSPTFKLKADAKWNNQPVSLKTEFAGLGAFFISKPTPVEIAFESPLLTFNAEGEMGGQKFNGKMKVVSPSLGDMAQWLSGQKQQKSAAVAVNLEGKTSCTTLKCTFDAVTIKVNDSILSGSMRVDMEAKPLLVANLSADTLDITPYLPREASSLELISSAYAAQRWSSTPIDYSTLDAFNGSIDLKIGHFIARKFVMDRSTVRMRLAGGSMTAEVVSDNLYQGKGNALVNLSREHVGVNVTATGVEIAPLIAAATGDSALSGKATLRAELSTRGTTEQALVANLGGDGHLRLLDGSIRGLDIAGVVRNAKSAFTNADASRQKTDFSEASGSFNIKQGVVSNDDLIMKAPLFRVSGKGTVDLPNYTINYRLSPELVNTLQGQGGKDKEGLAVPIMVTGSLDHPNYAPDVAGMVNEVAKDPAKAQKILKENIGNVKDFLKGGKQLLKGL